MQRRLPPLNALVVFEAAARHLSFTRASDELHVTQAAVSHQIKSIEDFLGVALFHRLGRGQGLTLTEAGREYLPVVTAALDSIRTSTDAIRRVRPKRVLNITTLDSLGSRWLLPRLARFRREHGSTDVRLTAAAMEDEPLRRGSAEIELRYGGGGWPDLVVERFMTETIFPVCSPELLRGPHPLRDPGDLRHHTLLHDVARTGWADWLDAVGVTDIDGERGPGFNHSNLVIQAAELGEGVALGRSPLVIDALIHGTLVRPFAQTLPSPYSYYIVTTARWASDPVVRAFSDWVMREGELTGQELDRLLSAEDHGSSQKLPRESRPGSR
ncbi:MAG TPA: transcriptional regulator GcvA [Steroidobacteraceae bacterium]|nr:transcriptional regulator GcvA [Steroidobacteraceae bacterium]